MSPRIDLLRHGRRWWKAAAVALVVALVAVALISRPSSDESLAVQTGNRPDRAEPVPADPSTTTTTAAEPPSTTATSVAPPTSGPGATTSTSRTTPTTRAPRPTTTVTTARPSVPPVTLIDPPSPPPLQAPPPPTTTTTLDPKAPRALSMTVTPREVDTSADDVNLTIRIDVSSPLGNVADGRLGVRFENGDQLRDVGGNAFDTGWNRVSGDAYRGIYQSVLTLYHHSAHGPWTPTNVSIMDTSGRFIDRRNPPASDFDGFTQTGPGDSEPPTVTGLSFTRIPDDEAGGQTQFLVKCQLSDPVAGIAAAPTGGRWGNSIEIFSPSGKLAFVSVGWPKAGTGPPERLDFETILNLGTNPEPGVWKLRWVQVGDLVGNQRYIPPPEITAAGFPTSFTVG